MKAKKVLLLLLCTMLVQGLFAKGNQDADENESGKVKIVYSNWGTPDEAKAVQIVADKFNATQERFEVEIMAIPHDTYITKLNTLATAKKLPDCGIMSEAGALQFAENGLLSEISERNYKSENTYYST